VDTNDNEVVEIPDKKFKRMIARMTNEINDNLDKYLNKLKENTNKHLNEIRKTTQDTKEKFNKDTEILKKIKLKL
jgi:hypothetical protein